MEEEHELEIRFIDRVEDPEHPFSVTAWWGDATPEQRKKLRSAFLAFYTSTQEIFG